MTARLAYLCADPGIAPDDSKGAAVHLRMMVGALRRAGATVELFVAREPRTPAAGVHVVAPEPAGGARRELAVLANSLALAGAIAAHGPFDAVYERLALFGLGGAALARDHGLPLVLEVNAPVWEEQARYRTLHLAESARAAALDAMAAAAAVLAVSPRLATAIVAAGVDRSRVHVVPNGADPAFAGARPAPRPPALAGRSVVVFSGSLKPWHGVDVLLDAVPALAAAGVGLWVVGDGPLRARAEAAARDRPDAVVVEGAVAHERMPAILAAADATVAPYPADAPEYFSPLKVVEALAAGCPLVASDTPCITDTIAAAERVELFAPGDAAGLAAAVQRSLAATRAEGRPRPSTERSWARNAARVLALLGPRPADRGTEAPGSEAGR